MENQVLEEKKSTSKLKNKFFKFKRKEKIETKDQIFKIVLTGLLLGLSVAFSLIELKIPIMGASIPLRIFDALIMAIAIPIIGLWYTVSIAIIEPWLHFAIDSDHPPIQMFFDNIANVVFVISFVLVFYKLFKLNQVDTTNKKTFIAKNTFAGLVLVPLNAIVSSLMFVFTMLVLLNTGSAEHVDVFHGDHEGIFDGVTAFFENASAIFFILLAIEVARFLLIYVLFALVQKRLSQLNRFQNNN
ncbi:hypothetical protein [Spiroplasma platyhelix]|uniref:Transmembrane protein n=1 Tax=Spiroplasma platyhelix PALS-1 TaxID=1276218 RepID=A0A846U5P7_9MOLU|nr:hypothetical protein [Spiroplasma platyhelix]MBE4704405.1 hypothetical protein [Spiroplasma platyhelix PALS-1]NKE38777.1 hypothetical protein [Spiroplasma platyhelix PALS-1]UJB28988.1 hypothetical protein SPLAT_v1c02230 [Spiroplasma platyhelix PALS-1]